MNIIVQLACSRRGLAAPSVAFVKHVARKVLLSEGAHPTGDLNFIFTDNAHISKINLKFLRHKGPTDVISFSYADSKSKSSSNFGDVFISLEEARRNAGLFHESVRGEQTRLIVHGLLHLLGYTDSKAPQKKKMWRKQEEILRSLHKDSR